jgi:hypothetical protein
MCGKGTRRLRAHGTHGGSLCLSVSRISSAWVAKLRDEGVKFLEEPYHLGDMRAVMIEGPSREAIEILEQVKPK